MNPSVSPSTFELSLAFCTAAVLTLFDLDRVFHIPSNIQRKAALYSWWWGFVILNGVIASFLLTTVKNVEPFKGMESGPMRAFLVGLAYLAVIRAKVTTFSYQGRDVPFGPEALYEAAKNFIYKRINRIAMDARYDEAIALANQHSIEDLVTRARLAIRQNAILSEEEKQRNASWLLSVLQDSAAGDFEKRATIADFILSGKQS
jgi:hypothetical protein